MQNIFQGTGVALITPFTTTGSVDFKALAALVNHCIDGGIDFLVALGTTGETATLSDEEQKAVLNCILEANAGRLPVILGMGGNNTEKLVEQIKKQDFTGISGILSVSPYYNKPTQEGIYQHYMALEKASPLPIIIYNVPGRTGSNISAQTTLRLAKASAKFVAVKEASGNIHQVMQILKDAPENFLVLSGDDNLTLPMMSCGAKGVISVIAQAYPKIYSDMVNAANSGDFKKAANLHFALFDITDQIFEQGNPAGIKKVLQLMNIVEDKLRLPLVSVDENLAEKLKNQMAKI